MVPIWKRHIPRADIMTALYVAMSVSFGIPHPVTASALLFEVDF